MVRTVLFLTLITATLIGPCLCCCALGLSGRKAADPVVVTAEGGGCPHCQPLAPEPSAPEPAPAPCHDCPVCAKPTPPAVLAGIEPPAAEQPVFAGLVPVIGAARPVAGLAYPSVTAGNDHCTFLLDRCHHLRC